MDPIRESVSIRPQRIDTAMRLIRRLALVENCKDQNTKRIHVVGCRCFPVKRINRIHKVHIALQQNRERILLVLKRPAHINILVAAKARKVANTRQFPVAFGINNNGARRKICMNPLGLVQKLKRARELCQESNIPARDPCEFPLRPVGIQGSSAR